MTVKLIRRILLACVPLIFLFTCSIYPKISVTDKIFIQRFANDWKLVQSVDSIHRNFESEIAFVSKLQDSVVTHIAHATIPRRYFGSVEHYYHNRKGFCFDRAVLMEKILSYYHFPYRHVYIYYGKNKQPAGFWEFFKRHIPSHALFEIKTKKGWMAVGTNENWLAIDTKGEVMDVSMVRSRLEKNDLSFAKNATIGIPFWENGIKFRYVYGLYSRHGVFFSGQNNHSSLSSMNPINIPDYNLRMLLYNF